MWLALIMSPAVTEAQSSLPVVSYWSSPLIAIGSAAICRLPIWVLSSIGSIKLKSLDLKTTGWPSAPVRVASLASG